jgi:hypothetical protein
MSSFIFPLVSKTDTFPSALNAVQQLNAPAPSFDFKAVTAQAFEQGRYRSFGANILKEYPWTLSNVKDRTDIPEILLKEYSIDESSIKRQILFYASGISGTLEDLTNKGATEDFNISVYDEIFPKSKGAEARYVFPYFTKNQFELNTSAWQQFDGIGQAAGQISSGLQTLAGGTNTALGKAIGFASKGVEAATAAGEFALKTQYPVTGIADRPRMFTSHGERSITIQFPLYNTISLPDTKEPVWRKNFEFLRSFMEKNLFMKRNFITGFPPRFYDVLVKNQYYSVASSVTNITVENLGNTRVLDGHVVPDAYQVSITLVEMAMPSFNQFQHAFENKSTKVTTSTQ